MQDKESIRRRRKKKRARKLRMIKILLLVLMVVVPASFVISNRMKDKKAEEEKAAQETARIENAKAQVDEAFKKWFGEEAVLSEWIMETYEQTQVEELFLAVEDGILEEKEVYDCLEESIYVLKDRYHGFLKDEVTAKQNHIYLRDGKNVGEAEITVAGDLCLAEDGFVLDYYDTVDGLGECISPEILEILNQSDIFYVNHEYCISDKGSPLSGKYYTFRADPKRMGILKEMGTDIVSLANNHVFDYGEEALYDTADLLEEAEIPYVGGGRNIEEAKQPVYFIINGIKIGFVAASNGEKIKYTPQATETTPGILRAYDTTEYNEVIQNASKECDYLIAYIHWGTEDSNYLNAEQQAWGREFLNSGADIVVGGHPHVLQGIEYVDGKPIIYSLGDFWFNHETKYTGVLKLNITYDGLKEMSFVPCLQTGFTTQYISDYGKQQELFDFLENLSINVEIDENGVFAES